MTEIGFVVRGTNPTVVPLGAVKSYRKAFFCEVLLLCYFLRKPGLGLHAEPTAYASAGKVGCPSALEADARTLLRAGVTEIQFANRAGLEVDLVFLSFALGAR